MRIRRRSLRKALIAVGCVVGQVAAPLAGLGGLLLLLGGGLHLWSKGCLEQNRRLTTAGPYRWTRNPFYLANALIDLGLCFIIGQIWVAAVYAPLWLLAYRGTIEREETRLAALFPEEMPVYRERVPRLLPSGRRLPAEHASGRFSLDNPALSRGREYARLLGIALAPGAIWAAGRLRSEGLGIFDQRNATDLGLLVLLLVGWVLKLGLAETFRRPETQLLPFGSRRVLRGVVALLLAAAALTYAGEATTSPAPSLLALVLIGWATMARAVGLGRNALRTSSGALGLSMLVALCFESGMLWLAAAPVGWCLLLALDELGNARAPEGSLAIRTRWRFLPAIAAGAVAMVMLITVGGRVYHRDQPPIGRECPICAAETTRAAEAGGTG